MSAKSAEPITANDRWIANADGAVVGVRPARSERAEAQWARLDSEGRLLDTDNGVLALSEAVAVVELTATGTALTGAGEFRGVKVRAVSGTVNLTIYDATSATGTPIDTLTAISLTGGDDSRGSYLWSAGARRLLSTGCHVVFSGGGTATVDIQVE